MYRQKKSWFNMQRVWVLELNWFCPCVVVLDRQSFLMPPCRSPSDTVVVPVCADESLIELRFPRAWQRCSPERWSVLRCPSLIRQWNEQWHLWYAHRLAEHRAQALCCAERPAITMNRCSTSVRARPGWTTTRDDKHNDREWPVRSREAVIHRRPFDPAERKMSNASRSREENTLPNHNVVRRISSVE